jgi:hypothetical protein
VAGGAAVSAALIAGTVSPALASTGHASPYHLDVCAHGNYAAFATGDGWATPVAQPGHCTGVYVPDAEDQLVNALVFGIWNTSHAVFEGRSYA